MMLAVLQARMGSSRLPGKSMMPLAGQPLVGHVMDRLQSMVNVDCVALATSRNARDTPLADLALQRGLLCIRGREADVLDRYVQAVNETDADHVMRVTGDCPLLCTDVASEVLSAYQEAADHGIHYVTNDTTRSGFPDGTDVEVFSVAALRNAWGRVTSKQDREHVTPWISRHYKSLTVRNLMTSPIRAKWSVDTADDLELVRRIMGHLSVGDYRLKSAMQAAELASQERVGVVYAGP
jgi:spore coat polysaccharide biosynthesis protein SpsF (cytidylyltransferase family)